MSGASSKLSVLESLESELECSVCHCRLKEPSRLDKCSHVFCYVCLVAWRRTKGTISCPECRTESTQLFKDTRLQNLLDRMTSVADSKCELCLVNECQDVECSACRRASCSACVADCDTCRHRFCASCMTSHVPLMKVRVMDLLGEIRRLLPSETTEKHFQESLQRFGERASSIAEKRKIINASYDRAKNGLTAYHDSAMADIENRRSTSLLAVDEDGERVLSRIEETKVIQKIFTANENAFVRLIDCRAEEELLEMQRDVTEQLSQLTIYTLADQVDNGVLDESATLPEKPSKYNIELLMPLPVDLAFVDSEREALKSKISEVAELEDLEKRWREIDEMLVAYCVDLYNGPTENERRAVIVYYNAMLKLTPTDVRELWMTPETPERYYPFLGSLLWLAYQAYEKCNLRYDLLKVYGRLLHTEWRSVVTMVQLLEVDAQFDWEYIPPSVSDQASRPVPESQLRV